MKRALMWVAVIAILLSTSASAEQDYDHISQKQAKLLMAAEDNYVIVDVRSPERFESSHIAGAINIPISSITDEGIPELPDKDQLIFVYDYFNQRSRDAAALLAELGYTQVVEFGGLLLWTGPIETEDDEYDYDEYEDDPFEAREYGDPEDFYYDFYDEFDDYEDAEDYYYEHGGW